MIESTEGVSRDRESGLAAAVTETGRLLATSLDYEETLQAVADLAVRYFADFCIIDLIDENEIRRLKVAHRDPAKREATKELLQFPIDRNRPHLSLTALETRKPVVVSEVTEEVLDSISQGQEHRKVLEALAPTSFMAVPMIAHDRLLGVVLFVSSGERYGEEDRAGAERLIQLASLEVDNARLYREAQHAIAARDRVLGIVAHDLRNPLNVIGMSAELLLDTSFPEERRAGQLQLIVRSTKRMERLIQDLLDIGRIEGDSLFLRRELLEPQRLAQEAVDASAALAAAKSLSLEYSLCEDPIRISADRDRILQVFSNLLGNAMKFTPEGGTITVVVECADDQVRFVVTDTGPGISPEDLPNLFKPFWQAQQGSFEGAGLGLMIARGIVEAHGGSIWTESVPGQGSTFTFTIPIADPQDRRRSGDRRAREGRTDPIGGP